MNVGIIVFSRTGNTLGVAERIREALVARGHQATVERVRAEHEEPDSRQALKLTVLPDPSRYDALIFGAAVEAFSLSAVMKAYLGQMPALSGKAAACLVTQHFSKPWMGGNRAIRQMRRLCQGKGLIVRKTGIVNWTNKEREAQIERVAAELSEV